MDAERVQPRSSWARGWEMLSGAGSELVFPKKLSWSGLWDREAVAAELGKALGGWWATE